MIEESAVSSMVGQITSINSEFCLEGVNKKTLSREVSLKPKNSS